MIFWQGGGQEEGGGGGKLCVLIAVCNQVLL